MDKKYRRTLAACFGGYFTQATLLNLPALLYSIYETRLGISLGMIALLTTLIFGIQLIVDSIFPVLATKLGYKASAVMSDLFSVFGLILTGLSAFTAKPLYPILAGTVMSAIGCGIIEVVSGPLVEALPSDNKNSSMSFLHASYCWGQLSVIIFTTLFFFVFGKEKWFMFPFIWALVPFCDLLLFLSLGKLQTLEDTGRSNRFADFGKNKIFVLLLIMMICAGATEQAIAQWVSYFAEMGLKVSKSTGDLIGTGMFALCMATARTSFGAAGKKLSLRKTLFVCGLLAVAAYIVAGTARSPIISLIGIGLCGIFIGMMWPGTIEMAGESKLGGGTLMFSLLALSGDIGCTAGPTLVGELAGGMGIKNSILTATVFPLLFTLTVFMLIHELKKKQKGDIS